LKDLALSGFTDVHVIDLDTIDISNLNRQFLFRLKDVGRPKSHVAAEFIMSRVPTCHVTAYHGKIQDHDAQFYKQFKIIISGLDNIEARRWLNSVLVGLVEKDNDGDIIPDTIIPLIDGGTEGFKGQARVILPKITSCFECSIDLFTPTEAFPLCTIAETPRTPEHCIAFAYILEWERHFPNKKLNTDSPEDMEWVFQTAYTRAKKYGIDGVTYFKTKGVVKNIIPAVASTNAIIAAACVSETFKLLTFSSQTLNNYFMYMGSQGLHTQTFAYERKIGCLVCSDDTDPRPITICKTSTLKMLLELLANDPSLQLKKPSIVAQNALYMQKPKSLEESLRPNLEKQLFTLIRDGEDLTVTDPAYDNSITLRIHFL
jgi:ubiquitin-activating enzyme E1 C